MSWWHFSSGEHSGLSNATYSEGWGNILLCNIYPVASAPIIFKKHVPNVILTSLRAGWGTCLDDSKESSIGLTTAGRKRPENFK